MEEQTSAPPPETATPSVKTEEKVQLSLQDLQNVLVIVDTACQRGAFKAPEMKGIGELYERINAYVKQT